MNEYQQELLEKIKQIDDLDILNLLADGALQRALRYKKEITPEVRVAADHFADEVEKLHAEAR